MILQVHDELVFDVPVAQVEAVGNLVRSAMENALQLSVPIEVELKTGWDWYDMCPLDGVAHA
jgi:DNA polymerase-1